jgi:FkbH-like protein
VCQYLPEVEVIQLPQDRAVEYREILAAGGWFDTLTLSEEDRQRGAMYRAEAARKDLQMQSQDLASYYTSLEMVLEVRFADPFSIPRIAQLTQKTNQFTLTTRRYSDAQIQELSQSDSADVIHVQLKDRFGESGLTGVCILRFEGNRALIDSFLLSCRVLGRGVEDAFLAARAPSANIGQRPKTAKSKTSIRNKVSSGWQRWTGPIALSWICMLSEGRSRGFSNRSIRNWSMISKWKQHLMEQREHERKRIARH